MSEFNEPWEIRDGEIPFTTGPQIVHVEETESEISIHDILAQGIDDRHPPCSPNNMRRIVACVNACAGIPTDCLERVNPKKNYHCQFDIEKCCIQTSEYING